MLSFHLAPPFAHIGDYGFVKAPVAAPGMRQVVEIRMGSATRQEENLDQHLQRKKHVIENTKLNNHCPFVPKKKQFKSHHRGF